MNSACRLLKSAKFLDRVSLRTFGHSRRTGVFEKYKSATRYTGIACGTCLLAATPILVKQSDNEIVANVYGGLRFFRSLTVGLWISIDYYISMLGLNEDDANYPFMMSQIHQRAADRILQACLENGGPYIKLGQGLVAMSHVLPKEYVDTLKVLQDKCLTRGSGELERIFMQDFGKKPEEMFKEFDNEPIAAASLAQVYKAKTMSDDVVAVKVQYIDLKSRFQTDYKIINVLLKIAGVMHPDFNFAWMLDDLKEAFEQELDFINEGKNAEKCAEDLKHLSYIYVPKIFWDYCSDRVLVAEFVEATKINEMKKLKSDGYSLADINTKLFEAFGHQIFQTGFVHADPHPGNVLVRKHDGKAQLVLLDHGLYQQINDDERQALSHMWNAIVLTDHNNMKKYSNQLGVEDYEIFAEVLVQAPLKSRNFRLKSKLTDEDLKFITKFARQRFDLIMTCLRTMPRTLLLVLRNLNTIRAIAHDHGNPIDRYSILARVATKSMFQTENLVGKITKLPSKAYFELKLLSNKINSWLRNTFFKILVTFGFVPNIKGIVSGA